MNFLTTISPEDIDKIVKQIIDKLNLGDLIAKHPVIATIITIVLVIIVAIPTVAPFLFNRVNGKVSALGKEVKLDVTSFNKKVETTMGGVTQAIDKVLDIPEKVAETIEPIVDLLKTQSELTFLLIDSSRAPDEVKAKARTVKASLDTKLNEGYSAISRLNDDTKSAIAELNKEVANLKKVKEAPVSAVSKKTTKKPKKTSW